ncbi:abortive infection family protein [Oceanibacterium hippocampi]|uniref:Abortive infection protein-like C-terminal domain-containing protein n=1 Tax=Oceanibacterium hippocampi TaxID=745714 RepID=A0A1Y5T626_9PROT|nr:abortive infection family protein [Oceanibacterium hippocampi]SLN56135.1 hypothetical protein OCH7691_02424 [Oceanibacterium hippocampi]
MKIGEAAISHLVEIAYNTGMSSGPMIAFFNSFGLNNPVVHMLDSKRRFANQAWRELNGSSELPEAINQILSPHHWPQDDERQRQIDNLNKALRIDGWVIEDNLGRLEVTPRSGLGGDAALRRLKDHGDLINHENLISRIRAIEKSVEASPADAIGAAKELIEAITKDIIEKAGQEPAKRASPSELVKHSLKCLDLASDKISDRARGVAAIRSTLTALSNIAHQLDELRGLYGSGHGRSSTSRGLEPRHARLAVGAASSLCLFLVETFEKHDLSK